MKTSCAMCGYLGDVDGPCLAAAPMLAFYRKRHRWPHKIDVWICDVCISNVRD